MAMTSDNLEIVIPANHVSGPKQGHWTYDHYAALPDDGHRYELVDGVLYMAPAPNIRHQNAVLEVASHFRTHVKLTGLGQVLTAPTDVQLAVDTVVQPDVIVILKEHLDRMKETRIVGAPDLVVEVASPGTITYDRREKYDTYALHGVSEYWLVDPKYQTVEVLTLENGRYVLFGLFKQQEYLRSKVVPSMSEVRVEQLFAGI